MGYTGFAGFEDRSAAVSAHNAEGDNDLLLD
jgi:hypothetical protein